MFILLDIDGVLNKNSSWSRPYQLDKECVRWFCEFVKRNPGRIILTSTWKNGFGRAGDERNTPQIKALEKLLAACGLRISGKTPTLDGKDRGEEVKQFLRLHPSDRYVIIDDDRTLYGSVTTHNYFCDERTGFQKKDIRRCEKCI